jgi:hypothetical protein
VAICRASGPTFALCTKIFMTERSTKSCRPAKAVLSLFGPKQIVEEDAQGRYRSLVQFVPSVLMKCMGAHLDATDPCHKLLRDCSMRG